MILEIENQSFELSGYRFFGATLWTDFGFLDDRSSAMLAAADKATGMSDYRKIRRRDAGKLHPKHTALLHADSRLALSRFTATHMNGGVADQRASSVAPPPGRPARRRVFGSRRFCSRRFLLRSTL